MVLVRLSTVAGEGAAGEARCAPRTIGKMASAARRRPPIKSRKGENPKMANSRLERMRENMSACGIDDFYCRDISNVQWLTEFEGVFDDEPRLIWHL